MKSVIVALIFLSNIVHADSKKCSAENLEKLARGYKKFSTELVKASIKELSAQVQLQKEASKMTSVEMAKAFFKAKKEAKEANPSDPNIAKEVEAIESSNPECNFK